MSVLFWNDDLDGGKKHLDWFVAHAQRHSLAPYLAVGLGFKGRLAILQGDARERRGKPAGLPDAIPRDARTNS